MATLTAGPNGFTPADAQEFFQTGIESTTASATKITETLSFGAGTAVLTGTFQLSPGGQVVGGTATALALYDSADNLRFSLGDVSFSVSTYEAYMQAHDSAGLVHYLFTGHDTYIGSSATDVLIGFGGNDTLIGGSGTEQFEPGPGTNTIAGGSGADMVIFWGRSSEYSIVENSDGSITVTDSNPSRNGTDHITNVQTLYFGDNIIFDLTSTQAKIALLYQGALDRSPDMAGIVAWEKAFSTEPASAQSADNFTALAGTPVSGLPNLAYGFTTSAEFQRNYGALTDAQYVAQLYANVLDRPPDSAGLDQWVNALATGQTREWVLVGFAESPEAYANAEKGFTGQHGFHPGWLMIL